MTTKTIKFKDQHLATLASDSR